MVADGRHPSSLPVGTRWCFSTLGCPSLDFDGVCAIATRYGIRELELRALSDRLDLPAYFRETFHTPEALARRVEASGFRISVLDTSLKLIGSKDADRESFLEFLPWAEALGCPWLRVFDGGRFSPAPASAALDEAAETVRWWRALRLKNQWRADIVIETHDAFCAASTCLAFEQRLPSPCPILWDTHHTFHKAGEALDHTWQALRPYVRHIHFKDSLPVANDVTGYSLTLPGAGRFPLAELFALLRRDGYDGAVCLEWERKWQPWLPPLEEALAALTTTLSKGLKP
jgi:sugar phosphate isomerase/epimerase